MWLHITQPENETRDCDFCKKYLHYSWRDEDSEKRGKPIPGPGRMPLPRPPRAPMPDKKNANGICQCDLCPTRIWSWSDENRALYRLWLLSRSGVVLDLNDRTAWAFTDLEDTRWQIEYKQMRGGN